MELIFYASGKKGAARYLLALHRKFHPVHGGAFFHNIEALSVKITQSYSTPIIAVLLATDHNDLLDFISIKHLLSNIQTILILPDQEKKTINRACRLFPRYITYAGGDLEDVGAVLGTMIRNNAKTTIPVLEIADGVAELDSGHGLS